MPPRRKGKKTKEAEPDLPTGPTLPWELIKQIQDYLWSEAAPEEDSDEDVDEEEDHQRHHQVTEAEQRKALVTLRRCAMVCKGWRSQRVYSEIDLASETRGTAQQALRVNAALPGLRDIVGRMLVEVYWTGWSYDDDSSDEDERSETGSDVTDQKSMRMALASLRGLKGCRAELVIASDRLNVLNVALENISAWASLPTDILDIVYDGNAAYLPDRDLFTCAFRGRKLKCLSLTDLFGGDAVAQIGMIDTLAQIEGLQILRLDFADHRPTAHGQSSIIFKTLRALHITARFNDAGVQLLAHMLSRCAKKLEVLSMAEYVKEEDENLEARADDENNTHASISPAWPSFGSIGSLKKLADLSLRGSWGKAPVVRALSSAKASTILLQPRFHSLEAALNALAESKIQGGWQCLERIHLADYDDLAGLAADTGLWNTLGVHWRPEGRWELLEAVRWWEARRLRRVMV